MNFGTTDGRLYPRATKCPPDICPNALFESHLEVLYKLKNRELSKFSVHSGTTDGTRTHMVSRWILNPVRLPIPPQWHM